MKNGFFFICNIKSRFDVFQTVDPGVNEATYMELSLKKYSENFKKSFVLFFCLMFSTRSKVDCHSSNFSASSPDCAKDKIALK